MSRRLIRSPLLSTAVLAVLGIATIVVLAQNATPLSASGTGQADFETAPGVTERIILTFGATEHTDNLGQTRYTGVAQEHNLTTGIKTTIDVTCIRDKGNNTVRIGGNFVRGTPIDNANFIVFDVQDNGEGSNAPPDTFNRFHGATDGCDGGPDGMVESVRGNIQVRIPKNAGGGNPCPHCRCGCNQFGACFACPAGQ